MGTSLRLEGLVIVVLGGSAACRRTVVGRHLGEMIEGVVKRSVQAAVARIAILFAPPPSGRPGVERR